MAFDVGTYVPKLVCDLYCYFGPVDSDVLDLLDAFGVPEQEAGQGRGREGRNQEGFPLYSLKGIYLYLQTICMNV